MRKCLINENSTQRHCNNLSNSRATQLSLSTSSVLSPAVASPPPGHYNTLQFNYGTEHNFPSNNCLHINHDGSPSFNVTSSNHHHNHNSTLQAHLHHSITSFNQNTSSNSMFQDNGYVLPNSFTRESNVPTSKSNTEGQMKSADKNIKLTHKGAIILKEEPDGTGIIQTGSLQAVIPSSAKGHDDIIKTSSVQVVAIPPSRPPRSDEGYKVIPSETHQSYFDIVKNT